MSSTVNRNKNRDRVFLAIFNQAAVGVAQIETATGKFRMVNSKYCEITGYAEPEMQQITYPSITHPEDLQASLDYMEKLKSGEISEFSMEKRYVKKDGVLVWVKLTVSPMWKPGEEPDYHIAVVLDITDRKLAERRKTLITDILTVLNRKNEWRLLIRDMVRLIKEYTGDEAIGVRIREGEDYPYYENNGFKTDFLESERSLCKQNASGDSQLGADGRPLLDCMCGTIISGSRDTSRGHFTTGGSFFTNDLGKLLSQPESPGELLFPRGRCILEGYESIALIPLKSENDIFGLLQFNDHRKNRFTPELVRFYEEIGETIGIAFQRMTQENQIRDAEHQYRILFDNAPFPRWVYDIQTLEFLDVNKSAVLLYGYSREEFLSMTLKDIRPPDEIPALLSNVAGEKGELQFSKNWHHLRKDGSLMDIEIVSHATTYKGRPSRVVLAHDVTERLSKEKELRNTKEYLEKLLSHSSAPIITWSPDLTIRGVNRAFEHVTGYPDSELIGKKLNLLFHSEKQNEILELIQSTSSGNYWDSVEIPILRKDGGIRHLLWNSANIYEDDQQTLITTIAQGNDITIRKQTEEALQRSEAFNRSIIDSSNDCIKVIGVDGTLLSMSKGGQKLMEIDDLNQVLNKSWIDFWGKPDQEMVREEISVALNGGTGRFQAFCLTGKGTPKWWDVQITTIRKTSGEPETLLSVSRDITENYEKEQLLRWENEVKEALAQLYAPLTNNDYSIHDFAGIVLEFALHLTGSRYGFVSEINTETKENVVHVFTPQGSHEAQSSPTQKPISFAPDPDGTFRGLFGYGLNTGQSFFTNDPAHHPAYLPAPPGHVIIEKFLCAPAVFENTAVGEIALANPPGDYKERDLEAISRLAEFYALAIQRKRDYTTLVNAKLRAEESDRLKSSLLNNMSHEFRTPMNAILGFSSLMENDAGEPEYRDMAHRINKAGNRLMNTLDDILELAELKAGIRRDHIGTLDLHAQLLALLPKYREAVGSKGLQINYKGAENLFVSMFPAHFIRVVDHIVANAIKFTNKGAINLELHEHYTDHKPAARLIISDTGIGIPKEYLSMIFEEFRQVSEGYGRAFEGTGLGLTIAHYIVQLYNGTISVESELRKGTTFIISFPLAPETDDQNQESLRADEVTAEIIKETVEKPRPAVFSNRMARALVVEDNTDNVDVIRFHLNDMISMDVAKDGDTAVAMSKINIYQLILMDIHLGPGKNGMDATREIRKLNGYSNIPIIAVTGYTTAKDKSMIFEAGCSHYLGKPFTKEELTRVVEAALR